MPEKLGVLLTPLLSDGFAALGLRIKWRSHPQTKCGEAIPLNCLLCVGLITKFLSEKAGSRPFVLCQFLVVQLNRSDLAS